LKKIPRKILLGVLALAVAAGALVMLRPSGPIIIFGDSQRNEDAQLQVAQAVSSQRPSAVFRVGDMTDNGDDSQQWSTFNLINAPLLKSAEYFPCLGNHENESPLYFSIFPRIKNRRWYSVERQGIHFIVLDSNSDMRVGSAQYCWLLSDLRRINRFVKYRVAVFHHPIFSVGTHITDEKKIRAALAPLLYQYGIRVVFSGHDHNYQRLYFISTHYIVTGGGGADLRDQWVQSPYLQKFIKAYHFCTLFPGPKELKVKVLDTQLKVIDEFSVPAFEGKGSVNRLLPP
jgi:predicted phosphodiesterase